MKHLFLICFLIFTFCSAAFSISPKKGGSFFSIEGGALVSNITKRFYAPTGFGPQISRIQGWMRIRPGLSLGRNYFLEPSLALFYPWSGGADGSNRFFTTQWNLDLGIPLLHFLEFRVGPGVHWIFMVPSSEVVTLDNGTGTSDFYTPSRVVNATVLTSQLGLSLRLSRKLSFNLEAVFLDVGNNKKRTINGAVSLGVVL